MDAKSYLFAAEMTDRLTTVLNKREWERVLIPELGSLHCFFSHMIRVRNVYRDGLLTGEISFPGTFISMNADLETELIRSRTELAEAIAHPKFHEIHWGKQLYTPTEICSVAIQHEGIHQGQWYVALKQAQMEVPQQWQTDWCLK